MSTRHCTSFFLFSLNTEAASLFGKRWMHLLVDEQLHRERNSQGLPAFLYFGIPEPREMRWVSLCLHPLGGAVCIVLSAYPWIGILQSQAVSAKQTKEWEIFILPAWIKRIAQQRGLFRARTQHHCMRWDAFASSNLFFLRRNANEFNYCPCILGPNWARVASGGSV